MSDSAENVSERGGDRRSTDESPNNAVYFFTSGIKAGRTPMLLNPEYLSHIFYGYARVIDDGTTVLGDAEVDATALVDGYRGGLRACTALRQSNPGLKIILSIGGPSPEAIRVFAMIAGDKSKRIRCAYTASQLVDFFGLDGIDIFWDNLLDQKSCNGYLQLLAEFRKYLPQPQFTLSSALSADPLAVRLLDLKTASHFLDLINLQTFDFAGPWHPVAGHASQVYPPAVLTDANAHCLTVVSALRYYVNTNRVPPSKLMLGVPTFGRSFLGAKCIGDTYTGCGGRNGTLPYYDLPTRHSIEEYDGSAQAAYCHGGDGGFVTYDNPHSVAHKAQLVKKYHLAGIYFTDGSADHFGRRSIIKAGFLELAPG